METGIMGEACLVVSEEVCAKNVGSGDLMVFSTPSMIALMEKAASESVAPHLGEGESTVGVSVNIKHIKATPLGKKVKALSKLIGIDKRRLVFEVSAFDEDGKIGEGVHERFIIDKVKFLEKIGG